jgi:hypothetical protein
MSTKNEASVDSLKRIKSFFEDFDLNLAKLDETRIEAYEGVTVNVDKILDFNEAESALNQKREELIDQANKRLSLMMIESVQVIAKKHLHTLEKGKELEDIADEIRKQMKKRNVDTFINRLKYNEFYAAHFKMDFNDSIDYLLNKENVHFKEKKIIPINNHEFILGIDLDDDNIYSYFVIDNAKRLILSQICLHFTSYCDLEIYTRGKNIVVLNRTSDDFIEINIYNMNFDLKVSKVMNKSDLFPNFMNNTFFENNIRLNDNFLIIFYDNGSIPYLDFYDLKCLKKVRRQKITLSGNVLMYVWFEDASNDYLFFRRANQYQIYNINTNSFVSIGYQDFYFQNALISIDSSYFVCILEKNIFVIRCCDQAVLFKCSTDKFFPNYYTLDIKLKFSNNQDFLIIYGSIGPLFFYLN